MTTYALLRRDLEELEKHYFNSIILDEAQNIKNPNTITARSVRSIKARMRLCLSGTPIENNLFELWSLFEFLMPGFLGSQHAFQRGVVKPIRDGDGESLEYLRSRVKPFILRRTKAEVAKDLPPKIESVTYCNMTDEQAELYTALTRKLRDQVLADVESKAWPRARCPSSTRCSSFARSVATRACSRWTCPASPPGACPPASSRLSRI